MQTESVSRNIIKQHDEDEIIREEEESAPSAAVLEVCKMLDSMGREQILAVQRACKILLKEGSQQTKLVPGSRFLYSVRGKECVVEVVNVAREYYWVKPVGALHLLHLSRHNWALGVRISSFSCKKLSVEEAEAEHERTKNNLVFLGELVLLLQEVHDSGSSSRSSLMVGVVQAYNGDVNTCRLQHPGFVNCMLTRVTADLVKMDPSILGPLSVAECIEVGTLIKSRGDPKVHRIASVHLCCDARIVTDSGNSILVKDVEPLSQQALKEMQLLLNKDATATTRRLEEEEDDGDELPLSSLLVKRPRVGK